MRWFDDGWRRADERLGRQMARQLRRLIPISWGLDRVLCGDGQTGPEAVQGDPESLSWQRAEVRLWILKKFLYITKALAIHFEKNHLSWC